MFFLFQSSKVALLEFEGAYKTSKIAELEAQVADFRQKELDRKMAEAWVNKKNNVPLVIVTLIAHTYMGADHLCNTFFNLDNIELRLNMNELHTLLFGQSALNARGKMYLNKIGFKGLRRLSELLF